jgi:hypothetical protein
MGGRGCTRCSLHGPNTHCPCHHNPFGARTAHPAFKQMLKTMPFIASSFAARTLFLNSRRQSGMGTGYHASSCNPALWDLGAEQDVNEVGHSWYARRNGEAERLRSLDVDDQLERRRLHDSHIGRLNAFANARGMNAKVAIRRSRAGWAKARVTRTLPLSTLCARLAHAGSSPRTTPAHGARILCGAAAPGTAKQ